MCTAISKMKAFFSRNIESVWLSLLLLLCVVIGKFTIEATVLKADLDEYYVADSRVFASRLERARTSDATPTTAPALPEGGNPAPAPKDVPARSPQQSIQSNAAVLTEERLLQKRQAILAKLCGHIDTSWVLEPRPHSEWSLTRWAADLLPASTWRNLDKACSVVGNEAVDKPALSALKPSLYEYFIIRYTESHTLFLSNFILPALYGLLGGILWVYRINAGYISTDRLWQSRFEEAINRSTYAAIVTQRLCLSIIAGLVIGWFSQPATKVLGQFNGDLAATGGSLQLSIAPYAVAFVIGHSVEVLFDLLERVALAVSGPVTRSAGQGGDARSIALSAVEAADKAVATADEKAKAADIAKAKEALAQTAFKEAEEKRKLASDRLQTARKALSDSAPDAPKEQREQLQAAQSAASAAAIEPNRLAEQARLALETAKLETVAAERVREQAKKQADAATAFAKAVKTAAES